MDRTRFRNPNLPLKDHDGDGYMITVLPQDCQIAVRDDPENCALAMAAKRSMRRLVGVHVYTTVAYFEFTTHIERTSCAEQTRAQIREFDRDEDFNPGDYLFLAVPQSDTFEGKKERNKKYRQTHGTRPNTGRRIKGFFVRPRGTDAS